MDVSDFLRQRLGKWNIGEFTGLPMTLSTALWELWIALVCVRHTEMSMFTACAQENIGEHS
ncbi:MAG: hypothetical protein ABIR35_12755 [Polaromonas sp.]